MKFVAAHAVRAIHPISKNLTQPWRWRRGFRAVRGRVTLGGDKNYDTRDFVSKLREAAMSPHVAQDQQRTKVRALDGRTTRQATASHQSDERKRVEEIFGWIKTIAGLRKTRHRGKRRVGWMFTFAAAAYNLVRMRNRAQLRLKTSTAPCHRAGDRGHP